MESLFSLPLPFQRRLTKMYTDTKSSYDFVKEPVQSAEDPELLSLHRKLRIQKDRLVSWGLEWSDPSQSPDIDESINKAGLSELVGSVMSTIKEILAEAEPLWQSSKRTTFEEKSPSSEKSKAALIVWDKTRFQDLVRDLTMSIDTLYDLSRTRQSARKSPPAKDSDSSSSIQIKNLHEERQFESTRMQAPQQIDPTSLIWPRDLKTIQPGTLQPAKSPRQIVFMRRPVSSPDSRKYGGPVPTVPVLLEYAPYDPIYSVTGITPSMTRFEKLFAALSQAYISNERVLSGLLHLIGYFEEAEHSRFCLLYALPTNFGPVDIESPRMPSITILSDLLYSNMYEPSLEVKYRLAYNVASAVFDLHAKGVVHGNVIASNVLFIEHQSQSRLDLSQVNMRQSFLASCDLFSDNATDGQNDPFLSPASLYRHPLDPRTTRYTRFTSESKSLDLYSLAMMLLEIGLWTSLHDIFPSVHSIPENPAAVLKLLAARCGGLYVKAVQACWHAPDEELSSTARPDVMHQKVFWKVSKALYTCCSIDESSEEDSEASDDSPPVPSTPLQASRSSTSQWKMVTDPKPSVVTPIETRPSWKEISAYEMPSASFGAEKTGWAEKPVVKPIVPVKVEKPKPKLRTYPSIRIAPEVLDFWHTGLMPHINHVLRNFYKKYPESVEISLESVGESPTTTKPTILVICTSVTKVRSILKKSLVYDKNVFGLKVCRGKVVRSRKRGAKRSMGIGELKAANPDHQDQPLNGASIGAYVGERHLPPVSFGGLIMVDNKPYGMTVHHMLDDPNSESEDEETDSSQPILRSSAHADMPDLTHSQSSIYSSGDEEYMYTLSDYESDFSSSSSPAGSEYGSDDEWPAEDEADDDILEPGDIKGIPTGCGESYLITQPAIDDVSPDFFPSEETRDEDHLDSFQLGEVYASSGIRRRTENDMVHEIDWALFEFSEHRQPTKNHIKNGSRHCSQKEGRYPLSVAPSTDLADLKVHCMARTSGLQSGRILPGMVIVKIYGRQTPSTSFQVAGKLGVPGDSGAWVVDNEKGRACGHVLAWSSRKRVAYICPMDVLVKDIGETVGARSISLPGGSEIYTSNSNSLVADQDLAARDAIYSSHMDRIVSRADPSDPADPSDVSDELATLLAELKLPPTPQQIDGLDPSSLESTSSSSLVHQGKQKEEVRIRLVPRDENQLGRRQEFDDLGYLKAAGMRGWRAKDASAFKMSGKGEGGDEGVVAS
ncbi:hypothetical protein L207DRAFT_582688 [Hyaloscypha variabilis F]|uniref:Protein kinase domain-containing protein n=1 Tax=Hyaloscypha variabilis (strain UAMH 11265 / GT02V1 / F) TaxID=1149755 RepID=A0A2J6RPQ3_HYAVF|nr:hypothetical protein L207DRAFT_582688 [Hyaloscypha variabilis F]